ncbi:Hypothetical predicted protein [Cloeon dipterum]|nr:Hypothetical predicted protein [Cloeon dipterum]
MASNTVIVDENQMKGQHDYTRTEEKIVETQKNRRGYNFVAIFHLVLFHSLSIYFLLFKLTAPQWQTYLWNAFYFFFSGFGVSAGVHRLWAHKTYKAKTPLKILLAICFAASGQETIRYWVRDHRIHHKFSETEADPYDVRRGFFYAHFGWLATKKSPLILEKGRSIDISDLKNCPIVSFHDKHYQVLRLILCFALPTTVPVYFWGEDWWIAFLFNALRFVLVLNAVFSLNSFGHSMGSRPYDT